MAKIAHREELEEEKRGSPHPPVKGEREEEITGNLIAELMQPEDIVLPAQPHPGPKLDTCFGILVCEVLRIVKCNVDEITRCQGRVL